LVYQSRKRGTLESDLLLSTFARDNLKFMSETELKEYDKVRMCVCMCLLTSLTGSVQLLDEADWDIYYWCTGERTPPTRWEGSGVLSRLKEHARNEGRVVRRMPALL
jgi:succinate dehydrogenase assembly factor 2